MKKRNKSELCVFDWQFPLKAKVKQSKNVRKFHHVVCASLITEDATTNAKKVCGIISRRWQLVKYIHVRITKEAQNEIKFSARLLHLKRLFDNKKRADDRHDRRGESQPIQFSHPPSLERLRNGKAVNLYLCRCSRRRCWAHVSNECGESEATRKEVSAQIEMSRSSNLISSFAFWAHKLSPLHFR